MTSETEHKGPYSGLSRGEIAAFISRDVAEAGYPPGEVESQVQWRLFELDRTRRETRQWLKRWGRR